MFDINFFRNFHTIKKELLAGEYSGSSSGELRDTFDSFRNKSAFVFNIETTNNCNMRCIMCPRTELMNRKIGVMDSALFEDIIGQISPVASVDIDKFFIFVQDNYNIKEQDIHENAFYFYIVSTHLILHGYGEPLLDPLIIERVKQASARDIPTYFSCVPANIRLAVLKSLMESGLGVLKFSIDSLSDDESKKIRGDKNNFTNSFKKINEVIKMKDQNGFKTKIVITMIDMNTGEESLIKKRIFYEFWKDYPVYAYIKSQDNRWLYAEDDLMENISHYESQYCEYPWTSLTIMVDGSVVPCTQDYNAEMVFGNVKNDSLENIWNSEKYFNFREMHISGNFPKNYKCFERCDQKLVYQIKKGINSE